MPDFGWSLLLIVLGLIGFAILAVSRSDVIFGVLRKREEDEEPPPRTRPQVGEQIPARIRPRSRWEPILIGLTQLGSPAVG